MWISPSKRLRRCDDIIIVRDFVHSQNKCKRDATPFPFLAIGFSLSSRTHLIIPGLVARIACVRPFKNYIGEGPQIPFYIHLFHCFFYTDPSLLFPFIIFLVVTRRLCSRVDFRAQSFGMFPSRYRITCNTGNVTREFFCSSQNVFSIAIATGI